MSEKTCRLLGNFRFYHRPGRLACSNPTSCAQVSKRLVTYIGEALLVLSPY
jgi:hypothetical protein